MDLLFTTGTGFSKELKNAIGFIDSDIPEIKIKPDIRTATRELINVIGNTTYAAIVANYKLPDGDEDRDDTLTEFAQSAVGIPAYALFAPANDLGHSPNGRKMRVSDDEKTPFEWMMARDDDNLQQRGMRAIDQLIKYMDGSFDPWKESDAYKESYKLFIRSTEEFNEHYQIDSRLLLLKLKPGINNCEKREIVPRIGNDLYKVLKEKRLDPVKDPFTDDEMLLLSYIQEACVFYALAWGIPRLQINLFPEGISQAIRSERMTVKGRVVPAGMEVSQTQMLFEKDAARLFIEIEALVKKMNPPPVAEPDRFFEHLPYGNAEDDVFVNT